MANTIGVLYLGRLVEIGPAAHLLARPRHPYTRLLVDAVPDIAAIGRQRAMLKGDAPDPAAPPDGCPFHPRCSLATERCTAERPLLRVFDGVRVACHRAEDMLAASRDDTGFAPAPSEFATNRR
jgi:peptide/nickel transport system ATP-binding protein